MKRLFLVIVATTLATGCVYSERRTPYGYSNYSTVTPVYPRYEQHYYRAPPPPRYVIPVPVQPRFRSYEEHHEHEPHSHRRPHREYKDRDDEHSHHRW
ncbi:MAG: hypothetical protein WBI40_02435 [Methylococcaceae bacterium]